MKNTVKNTAFERLLDDKDRATKDRANKDRDIKGGCIQDRGTRDRYIGDRATKDRVGLRRHGRWSALGLFLLILGLAQGPAAADLSQGAVEAELRQQATSLGSARVIVRLATHFVPEGHLENTARVGQQQSILQDQQTTLARLPSGSFRDVVTFTHVPYLAMTVDSVGLEALLADPGVQRVSEDRLEAPLLDDTVPKIGGTVVHDAGWTGAGQAVAILDTGVDRDHPFLAGRVVFEACFSTTDSVFSSTSVCPNGGQTQEGVGAAAPCGFGRCDHGTHVAGIAAGRDSGEGFSGVAPDAEVIAIQVFSKVEDPEVCGSSDPCPRAFIGDLMRALERVYNLREDFDIAAINMSLGGGRFEEPCDDDNRRELVDLLRSVGIATVISAGNDGETQALGAPACIPGTISVGATDLGDDVAGFSNSADFLALLAPGVSVESSVTGDGFGRKSGTSMAAPHVAGTWAVLREAAPGAEVDQIEALLADTGVPVQDDRDGAGDRVKPRIQIDAAIDLLFCDPPSSGDWRIDHLCLLDRSVVAPRNLVVEPEGELVVTGAAALNIDFSNHHLLIRDGSRVRVLEGGKIY